MIYRTHEQVSAVTYCIAKKTEAIPREMPDGSRQIMVKNMYGAVAMTFDIFPDGSNTRVEYRRGEHVIGANVWKPCLGPSFIN